jgi:Secreted and surface protein containing fasciclin-like repeats
MFSIIHKKFGVALLATALLVMQSCNKEFEDIPTVTKPVPSNTIGDVIETDASFSILKVAATKAGLMPVLKNPDNKLTFFAVDDAAIAASGLSLAAINAMPAAQLNAILSFNIIPQALPSSSITALFPPLQMPTLLALDPTNPLVKMNIFISKRGTALYANNIPVKQADIAAGNGVIHKVAALVAPPSKLLSSLIYDDPQLSLFEAAILRGDVGSSGLTSIDFLLKYPVVNFTVFAPTNDAMKVVINQLSGGAVPLAAPDQVFIDFINNFVPVQTAQGIVAYHILGTRAFAANLPEAATYIPTLVNLAVPSHPGVQVQSSFTGPFATGLKVTGVGNGGVASNVIVLDKNAVNGVLHIIDRVLLPQ